MELIKSKEVYLWKYSARMKVKNIFSDGCNLKEVFYSSHDIKSNAEESSLGWR